MRNLFFSRTKQPEGFTLIEVMLVIAVITVLAGIVGYTLDIPDLFISTHDSARRSDAKQIENAMYQYLVDEWEIANDEEIPEGTAEDAEDICAYGVTGDATCVNLDDLVDKNFLFGLPVDISESNPNYSGYRVYKQSGRPRIVAGHIGELKAGSPTVSYENACEVGVIRDGVNATELKQPHAIAIGGNYAYVTSIEDDALSIFNISDPENPVEVATLKDGVNATELKQPHAIAIGGNYAYVTSIEDDALSIFNISDPENPVEVATLKDGVNATELDSAYDVVLSGNYAYVVSSVDDALSVFHVSDPVNPMEIATMKHGVNATQLDNAIGVAASDDRVYVLTANNPYSLTVFDVSTPSIPVELGVVSHGIGTNRMVNPIAVVVTGDHAYIASADEEFSLDYRSVILDVSNPANISELSFIGSMGGLFSANDIAISGNYAFIPEKEEGKFSIYNISNPATPTEVVTLRDGVDANGLNGASAVAVAGGYAYVVGSTEKAVSIIKLVCNE